MPRKRVGEEAASNKDPKRMKQTTLPSVFLGKGSEEPQKTIGVVGRLDKKDKTSQEPKESAGTLSNVRAFFNHAKKLSPENPLEAFSQLKKAKLCGFFERIDGGMENKEDSMIRLHCRHTTDLPEMMTCCEYDGGRYAIWRDDPNQKEVLFVHVSNDDHFPAIQVVGDRFEHVLFHLGGKESAVLNSLLPEDSDLQKIYKEVQEVVKQRNKKKLGNLPNGVGIWVPVRNNVGYRELGANTQELKKILTTIGTSDNFNLKKKAEERLTELCAHATMANDELDFGMCLELGHFLWLANFPALNKRARQLLVCAYNLLERNDYSDIVKDHFEKRDADHKKQIEECIKAAAATINK